MSAPALIAVDWGLSNFRAFLIDRKGNPVDILRSERGILNVEGEDFPGEFHNLVKDWLSNNPNIPIILSGMVGSEQGWSIAPHVPCPVAIDELVRHLKKIIIQPNRYGHIIPGLSTRGSSGIYDIMRSEETQIFGIIQKLKGKPHIICLPGTHCK